MGGNKVGNYSFPSIRIDRAIEILKRIASPPFKGEISQTGLAQELKMSEAGGAFVNIVGSLRDYGLVSGKGNLQITELGKRIVTGTPEESSKSKAEAFLRVPLFDEVYKKIGTEIPDEEKFAVLMGEMTQEDRLKVKEKAKLVASFYNEALRYLGSLSGPEIEGGASLPQIQAPFGSPQRAQFIEVKVGPYYQKLPFNKDGLETAVSFLQSLKPEEIEQT